MSRKTDRLIIDLRGNIGGSLGFARLASYMCPGEIAIGHSLTPRRLRNGYDPKDLPRVPMPSSRPELLLTLTRFAFRDKSVMLLTQALAPSHSTTESSCSSTNGQTVRPRWWLILRPRTLATIVGQKTRGNVLGAINFKVGSGYWLRLPVFGWHT